MVDEVKATPPAPPRALEEGASIRRISYGYAVDEESAHLCAGFFSFFFFLARSVAAVWYRREDSQRIRGRDVIPDIKAGQ